MLNIHSALLMSNLAKKNKRALPKKKKKDIKEKGNVKEKQILIT